MRRRPSVFMASALVCLLGAAGGGCGLIGSEGSPEEVAALLADRLAEHSLAGVPLTRDSDRERFGEQVSALVDYPVEVTVTGVTERQDAADVTLAWEWDLTGRLWRYTTTAHLVDDGARWEVDWAPHTFEPSLKDGHDIGVSTLAAPRGRILGAGDVPLVKDRAVLRYGLDKTAVPNGRIRSSARRIAEALDINQRAFLTEVEATGTKAFVEGIVLRVEDGRDLVPPDYARIPGAVALEGELPLAPTREFAAELLGRVGEATAEVIEQSGGRIQAGDVAGLSGLQARYDELLSGAPGLEVYAVSPDGQSRTLVRRRARQGRALRTTLDLKLQSRAEEVLSQLGPDGPRSALVAVRPSDGSILVVANGPANGGLNVATSGQYAPGSTFKVVTALALLRAGVAPDDVLPCRPSTVVDGRSFGNYDDYPAHGVGDITFTDVIAHSCNTALIEARDHLRPGDLADAAAALGLGRDHDLGFPAYFGQVPAPSGKTDEAAQLIGQGTVLASPLTMASVAASVAAGRAVIPTLLTDHPTERSTPGHPIMQEEAKALRGMMRAVVTGGSGQFLADLPGEVGAKTGTAEYGQPDAQGELATHAWMIAIRGDLAVSVFVETGESGSATAGPLLEQFLRTSP